VEWDWEKGENEFLKTLELNPNHVRARIFYAHLLTIMRQPDNALHQGKIAESLDPLNPLTQGLYAVVLAAADECEAAKIHAEKGLAIESDHYFTHGALGGALECLGDYATAFEMWKATNLDLWETYEVTSLLEKIFLEKGWIEVIKEAIKLNEELYAKDGRMGIVGQAERYVSVGKYDRAMDYYEQAYTLHLPDLPYLSQSNTYNLMKNNPRYIVLLKKMNLPVDP